MTLITTAPPTVAIAVEGARTALHQPRSVRRRSTVSWSLVATDAIVAAGAGAVTAAVADASPRLVGAFALAWVTAVTVAGGYRHDGGRHGIRARALARAAGLLAITAWAATALAPGLVSTSQGMTARWVLLLTLAVPMISALLRLLVSRLTSSTYPTAVVVGHPVGVRALLDEAHRAQASSRPSFVPVGVCLADGTDGLRLLEEVDDLPVWFGYDRLLEAVRSQGAESVIAVSGPGLGHAELRRWGTWLQDDGVELLVSPGLRDVSTGRLELTALGGARLLRVRHSPLSGPARMLKDLFDRTLAGLLLLVLSPVLLVLALLVRADSPGPAVYRQSRVGRHGRLFTVYKLRTMCADADKVRTELQDVNESDRSGVLFKMRRDPRITRLGRMLRKFSLDELPQLINVVRGEMSLVGPRPALPSEVRAYSQDLRRRLVVKPGLTGLWQVSGRSDLSWEETVRLDLQYVDNWSWSLDLSIAARTVKAVLGHQGAY